MLRELLKIARGVVDEAEVYESETDRAEVKFRQGKLHSVETKLSHGWGLRVIDKGRLGFASSTNPGRHEELVAAAKAAADYGRQVKFHLPKSEDLPVVGIFENRVMLVSTARMQEWGRDLVEAMAARVPELKLDINFHRVYREVRIVNTSGLEVDFARAEFGVWVTGLLVDEGIYSFDDYVNLSDGRQFPLEELVERMHLLVKLARSRVEVKTGDYPVIVMPIALGELLFPLEVGVNGRQREKRVSPLLGQENKQVLSEKLTIVDNPLRNFGLNSAPFDGEGVPSRRNVLFARGVFRGFIFDIATASACGTNSTGSALRDYTSLPAPGITNIELDPGDAELERVLREIKEGLLVYAFIGGGQSNVLAGEVALNVSCGFKVEKGEVVGRVKDLSIAGNVYDFFQRVAAVGSTQRDLGNAFLPFVFFSSMKVAAKG